MAEHRLERVLPFADRIVVVPGGGASLVAGPPAEIMRTATVAPPLIELGRYVGWDPLPLTVRDARRQAAGLRARIAPMRRVGGDDGNAPTRQRADAASLRRLAVHYGPVVALQSVDLDVHPGEVTVLMGRNGSGKSSLLNALSGGLRPTRGSVRVGGKDPVRLHPRELIREVGLVPQDPGLLLFGETVGEECRNADHSAALDLGTTLATLQRVLPGVPADRHPRDLSEGQRLALALAIVLAPAPPLLLLDEPTRGLDYPSKDRLITVLRELAGSGHAVVLATHDVELAARVAQRAVVLADGEVIADGPSREVVCHSPVFAPQIAKVLAPDEWLTLDEVRAALEAVPA
jgi:energy-coupling factor transport system ATP-binding protein